MDRNTALAILKSHARELRMRGVTAMYLFGSTATGEAEPGSDVDVFVDYDEEGRFSLVELAGVKSYLEGLLKAEADVVTRDSLHPLLKDRILKESIRVFDETT